MKAQLLAAARASAIPVGESGLWYVRKCVIDRTMILPDGNGVLKPVPPGSYTMLFRWTTATLHKGQGECVMNDMLSELNTHLDFMLRAHGRVLITGLGLGCVTRGVLANPAVQSVTVIERDPDVLKLVRAYMPADPRLTIIEADAVKWCEQSTDTFDCAWHDLWTDEGNGEPHLQLVHNDLIIAMRHRVKMQGAWQYPRGIRRIFRERRTDAPFQFI
jgi:hypothetical protein